MKLKQIAGLALLTLAAGCMGIKPVSQKETPEKRVSITSAKGTNYALILTSKKDRYTPNLKMRKGARPDEALGTSRAAQRSAPFHGPLEAYKNLWSMVTELPTDEVMLERFNPKDAEKMERMTEEKRVVQTKAWLFGARREADNSLRLLLGSQPYHEGCSYFTAVVMGVPQNQTPDRDQLAKARQTVMQFFAKSPLTTAGYTLVMPPPPIIVTGSPYFAVNHGNDAIGPEDMTPGTAWELCPVTDVIIEP